MSTSNPSNSQVLNSPFQISTLPKKLNRSSSSSSPTSSINSLYEVEYVPGDQLPETTLPLVNPYDYFSKKPNTFSIKGVRELIRPSSSKRVLEYVQASKFSSCQVPATEEEQFISLTIPEHLPRIWQQTGFTHLHFGVVRIGLTLHARKGLPVVARIALVDSRLKSYQQACIGTVQATLNAGTVFVTLFPNFNVSLKDPNLLQTLKVQLQLVGAPMQEKSVIATLHHQIVYRVQDHALDLALPSSDEALYLEVTSATQAPTACQIPRQISRDELLQRLPESWVTSYEKFHQATQTSIHSSEATFHSRNDGTTEIKFDKPRSSSFRKQLFTQFAIQIDKYDEQIFECRYTEQIPKPLYFGQDGTVTYPFQDENGHQYWDICSCSACEEDRWNYESDNEKRRRRRKKKDPLYKRYLEGDPTVGPLGDDKYDFIVEYSSKKEGPTIMMMQTNQLPPNDDFTKDGIAHCPKILTRAVNSSGPDQLSQGEKVLNWQTENAIAQNQLLTSINNKVDQLSASQNKRLSTLQSAIIEIHGRLNNLHQEMTAMAQHMMVNTSNFRSKEAETTNLKNQLKDLQSSLDSMIRNRSQTDPFFNPLGSIPSDIPTYLPTYQGSYSPGFLSGYQEPKKKSSLPGFLSCDEAFTSRFGSSSTDSFRTRTTRTKPRRQKDSEFLTSPTKKPALTSSSSHESTEDAQAKGKDKDIGIIEFSMSNLINSLGKASEEKASTSQLQVGKEPAYTTPRPVAQISHFSDTSSDVYSNDDSSEIESIPKQFAIGDGPSTPKREPNVNEIYSSDEEMHFTQNGHQEIPPKQFSSKVMIFTFDDIPFEKWTDRLDEFNAWMTSEALTSPLDLVIRLFTARLSGALKEWWTSLGEYRQQQVYQTTIPALLGEIHREFIGTPTHLKEQLQEEFFTAKCCSLKKRDLAKHFERQTKRYYALNGLNNPSLKQVYLSSIDEYLSQQTKLYIRDQGQTVEDISIGQIQQYVFRTLDKLCKQKEFWTEFMDKSKHLSKICARPDLSIKCSKSKKSCSCDPRRKYRSSRRPFQRRFNKFRRKRFFRKKRSFEKTTKCFLCHKEGHYAKNCPNKSKKKKQYLINSISSIAPDIDLDNHDLESVLSYDSDDKDALCGYSDYDNSSESSDNDEEDCCFKITQLPKKDEIQIPQLPVTIFDPARREKPVHVIAFIDTGAHSSIMNPKILPSSMWLPHHQEFRVANAGSLSVDLKSKPITIEFFPGCQITTEVLGSAAPGKDLVMGWDTFCALKNNYDISLEARGLQWKAFYKPFTTISRLFTIEEATLGEFKKIKEEITTISCADSHTDFLTKCNNPLWLNSEFFVKLPFKENVHTTPTRASHAGMPPTLLQQANEECDQLVNQGIVSSTNSPWACKAFYVNNRAEQARGKLRLVIDYKPLNQYLQDVKFPLPNKKALLQHLEGATIFSKFDLKSGFWQIGVHPDERYKTAFCLPNRHLQWNVLPFGLKTAPSLFQQAMLRMFKPLLHTALIYIDDILLFSTNIQDHIHTLKQFQAIIKEYGLMLSARKMIIAQPNIDFLGMQIKDGQITPQSHLATTLLDFPNENLTKRQVQQFLGVINYVSDFIPQLSQLTRPLQKMLSKNPPLWATRQTEAVNKLKMEIQKLPTLQIPSSGTRILQTDASDKYWGAILFEEKDEKRQICGYKSGRFKDSEMHYHSTFKEILAVKKAIEKFEFHLIGHKFRIEMDMSSFPKMLQFKQKMVPHQQLLRWSEWFSKYDFESFYLKGKKNTLADMLSRKPLKEVHDIHMMASSSTPTKHLFDFNANIPSDAHELIKRHTLRERLRQKIFEYQSIILSSYGPNCHYIAPVGIHPDFPFAHLYRIENSNMPEEVLCFLWYLCSVYTIGITFDIVWLYQYINALHERTCLSTFLTWFTPLPSWIGKLRRSAKATNLPFKKLKGNGAQGSINPFFNPHTVYFFHRPVQVNIKSNKLHALPTLIHHHDYNRGLRPDFNLHDTKPYEDFQTHAFRLNNARQTFHIPFNPNWYYYPTVYQMSLDEDLMFFASMQDKKVTTPPNATKTMKRNISDLTTQAIIKQEPASPKTAPQDDDEVTQEYFQDAQLPDDSMNIDEIERRFNIDVNTKSEEDFDDSILDQTPEYECPGDEYGCCDEHILEFEMDH